MVGLVSHSGFVSGIRCFEALALFRDSETIRKNLALFRESAIFAPVWRIRVRFGNPDFRRSPLHLPPRRRVAAGCRIKFGRRVCGGACFTIWLCFGNSVFRGFGFVSGFGDHPEKSGFVSGIRISGVRLFIFRHADAWRLDAGSSPAGGFVVGLASHSGFVSGIRCFEALALFRNSETIRKNLALFRESVIFVQSRSQQGCENSATRPAF